MAEFEKLGQSDGEEGQDKRTLLLSHPIKLIITCVNPPAGTGFVDRLRKFNTVRIFGVDESSRICSPVVDNPFCLFYALVLSRRYIEQKILTKFKDKMDQLPIAKEQLMTTWSFRRFHKNKERMTNEVMDLMTNAKIPQNLEKYGIAHLNLIQEYWDRCWPNMFRIVAFEEAPEIELKTLWKGNESRHFIVPIYLQNNHWDGIKKIHKFFQLNRKFCIDCETPYDAGVNHNFECPARCYYCSSMGIGHPCPREEGITIDCDECNRTFYNKK
jgi:hypothetical protein